MPNIYNTGEYLEKHPNWHVEDSPFKAKNVIKMINKIEDKVSSICEVGCGAGEILNQLHNVLPQHVILSGFDISPDAISICQKKEKDRLHFFQSDLLGEAVHFDLVLALDVFEHVEDYIGFLKKLKQKGNYFIFQIPLDISAQAVIRSSRIMASRDKSGHLHYFTKETALATLEYCNYSIQDYYYTTGIDLPGRGWKANLAKLPRKLLFKLNEDFGVRLLGGYALMVLAK